MKSLLVVWLLVIFISCLVLEMGNTLFVSGIVQSQVRGRKNLGRRRRVG